MTELDEFVRIRARLLLTHIFDCSKKENGNMDVKTEIEDGKEDVDAKKEVPQHIKNINNLERGVFNWSIQYANKHNIISEWSNEYFRLIYKNKLRSVTTNLSKTPTLIQDIADGKTLAQNFASLTHMDLVPTLWNDIILQLQFANQAKLETTVESMTDAFECRKCHSRKTTYYQLQTRCADEPMTVFVSCLECGSRWKC